MSPARSPPGVEHSPMSPTISRFVRVSPARSPPGVEHRYLRTNTERARSCRQLARLRALSTGIPGTSSRHRPWVSPARSPPGVEHRYSRIRPAQISLVSPARSPPGVEHSKHKKLDRDRLVSPARSPPGVEHCEIATGEGAALVCRQLARLRALSTRMARGGRPRRRTCRQLARLRALSTWARRCPGCRRRSCRQLARLRALSTPIPSSLTLPNACVASSLASGR